MSAGARAFALPDLGEGLEDAILVDWHVAVGDDIELNQPLCTVETAKATVEIPSPFAGLVAARVGEPGDTILVGDVLVEIEARAAEEGRATDDVPPILVGYGPRAAGDAPRRRRRGAAESPAESADAAPPVTDAPKRELPTNGAPLAKPPVRHLARQLGVDLATLAPGSGPGGVITRADVTRAAEGRTGVATQSPPAPPSGTRAAAREIPLQGIRARIADRMTVSHASIPDAGCAVEADCSQLFAIRDAARAQAPARDGADAITPFALILRLLVTALVENPILNSVLDTEAGVIRVHDTIHLGVGTSTDRGLLVPVVRNAEQRTTIELAREVRRLADGARTGTLAPAELVGSTFTVSNFGSFGIDDGYPVINHPEVAILGVGAIRPRAVVVDGALAARRTARLTCSFDHRVCDGADVGRFLARLRALVESPGLVLLDV